MSRCNADINNYTGWTMEDGQRPESQTKVGSFHCHFLDMHNNEYDAHWPIYLHPGRHKIPFKWIWLMHTYVFLGAEQCLNGPQSVSPTP